METQAVGWMNAQGPWHRRYLNKSNDPENWYDVSPPFELPPSPVPLANVRVRKNAPALQGRAEPGQEGAQLGLPTWPVTWRPRNIIARDRKKSSHSQGMRTAA